MASGAVVIGCSAYEDPDIAPLRYAHRDAARFAATLTGICGVAAEMMLVLSDDAEDSARLPTRTNIVRQLTHWDRLAAINETLFCFFSGHGFQSGGDQYLLPIDCVRRFLDDTALKFELLLRLLSVSPARHVVLLLDACRNVVGGGKASVDDLPRANIAELCPPGMVTFCSCQPGRMSYEAESIQSGIFTAGLCEALSDVGRCRTIYELDNFLIKRIPEITAEYDKPRQDPYTKLEPRGVQNLLVVSALQQNLWLAATPIGGERRGNTAPVLVRQRKSTGKADLLVAFDFGTSYSAAATVGENGESMLLPWSGQRILMPSVVHFLPELDYLVGAAAVEADRYRPQSSIWNAKRALGTDQNFEIDGRSISPQLATSLILRSLRASVEDALRSPVRRCLASYPANFGLAQRNALQEAFDLADLDVERMIGEPNAAALTLKVANPGWEGTCMVVDLGGGTFDVAVVDYGYGTDHALGTVCEIRAVAGSNTVGGLDYDLALARYAEREVRERTGWDDPLDSAVAAQLRREANRAKRELGTKDTSTMLLQDLEIGTYGLQDISIQISREQFREITEPLNAQIRETLQEVMNEWQESFRWHGESESGVILLAGQGSKIFTVRRELDALDLNAAYISKFQETAVAQGLGWQVGVLSGSVDDILLLDLSHLGIGIRCKAWPDAKEDGQTPPIEVASDPTANTQSAWIVNRDTTIPTKRVQLLLVAASPSRPIPLEMIEQRRHSTTQIGTIMLPSYSEERELDLWIDINAGNTVTVTVDDHTLHELRRFQLNNLHTMPPPFLSDQYEDLRYMISPQSGTSDDLQSRLSQGYTIYPVQPINTPISAPGSGVRLDNFVQSELAVLDAKIAEAQRSGRVGLTTDRRYAGYYRARARLHEDRQDVAAAALDYTLSLGYGFWWSCPDIARLLPQLQNPAPIAAAIEAGLSALDQDSASEEQATALANVGTLLADKGYDDVGSRCQQLAQAARPLD